MSSSIHYYNLQDLQIGEQKAKTLSSLKLKKIDVEILVNLVGDKERYLKSHMVLKSWDLRNFLFRTPFIQSWISLSHHDSGLNKIDGVEILSFISRSGYSRHCLRD
ncbi:unnamed protein product [Camellia sinensis]